MGNNQTKYSALSPATEKQPFLKEKYESRCSESSVTGDLDNFAEPRLNRKQTFLGWWIMPLLVASHVATFGLAAWMAKVECHPSTRYPVQGMPPSLAQTKIEQHPPRAKVVPSTFYDGYDAKQDRFRKHSSFDADAMWRNQSLIDHGVYYMSKAEATQFPSLIDPEINVYIPGKGYPVKSGYVHVMHCLNTMRTNLYFNYEHAYYENCHWPYCDPDGHPTDRYAQLHVDHCLEYLRLHLECEASLTWTPMIWIGNDGRVSADMRQEKTCGDFDSLWNWLNSSTEGFPSDGSLKPRPGDYRMWDYI